MAVYIPAGRRRRRTIMLAVTGLLVGVVLGGLIGRASAPTVDDQLASVRDDAREVAAGLRVVALHGEEDTESNQTADSGADLVLDETRTGLQHAFEDAPWLGEDQQQELLDALDALTEIDDRSGPEFAQAAEALATQIEATFGVDTGS
jgi:hypothetical protein